MSDYTPSVDEVRDRYADARVGIGEWTRFDESVRRAVEDALAEFDRMIAAVKAEAIREYVAAARENPHTYYWPPVGVLDDAEQWADEIEKGTIR